MSAPMPVRSVRAPGGNRRRSDVTDTECAGVAGGRGGQWGRHLHRTAADLLLLMRLTITRGAADAGRKEAHKPYTSDRHRRRPSSDVICRPPPPPPCTQRRPARLIYEPRQYFIPRRLNQTISFRSTDRGSSPLNIVPAPDANLQRLSGWRQAVSGANDALPAPPPPPPPPAGPPLIPGEQCKAVVLGSFDDNRVGPRGAPQPGASALHSVES
ncbi:hypothetical protein JYU34_002455 [Plutella xylostella]|uniref:Uncharacterized protein n=1 Tax=Plutella xylostella TaxID=51655 RepID=A0ABQ7R2A1_PLUXY|nr:hypothetical protein JYU34_002455 [Plutella xylostella]